MKAEWKGEKALIQMSREEASWLYALLKEAREQEQKALDEDNAILNDEDSFVNVTRRKDIAKMTKLIDALEVPRREETAGKRVSTERQINFDRPEKTILIQEETTC